MALPNTQPNTLTLTDAAQTRVRNLLAKADDDVVGLRVGVRQGGCSGMMYEVDYAREKKLLDETVEIADDLTILVDPMALMFLVGSEMDYQEDKFAGTFVFNNPNASNACGCGESFMVDREQLAEIRDKEN
jgi:iron-sulfur cluster assembly accessory protein